MANNYFSSRWRRHVKHHTVRVAIERGIIFIEHVCSEEQHAGIIAKALDVKTVESHVVFLANSQ